MKIFVTGGSGFVGGHLIEALFHAGHEIVALARSAHSAGIVRSRGAAPLSGDLDTIEARDLVGCDVVIHAAAFVEEWGTRAQFWNANVRGTERMLQAARAAGVRRFIHVGTEAALFEGHDLVDVDETHPYPKKQRFLYSETKAEAEKRVLAENDDAFMTLSIRPRFVWGPRDTSVLPALLRMVRAGSFAFLDDGRQRTSTTHVHNLVHALVLALTKGVGGRSYFVADDGTQTVREFLTELASTQGVVLPTRSMKGSIARTAAFVIEGIYRLFRIRRAPPMTRFTVSMMSRSVTVNTDRARTELGYAPIIDVAEGIRRLSLA